MFPRGYGAIIWGIISLLGLLLWMYSDSRASLEEANDIRENGYYYEGTTIITSNQFTELQQYNGFHGGKVSIIELEPLTIQYSFGSLIDYPYLNEEGFSSFSKMTSGIGNAMLPVLFIIPLLLIFIGIADSKNIN